MNKRKTIFLNPPYLILYKTYNLLKLKNKKVIVSLFLFNIN